ncbi:hypothetical protein Aperf_G00000100323 [Anoplocephala perfoliata]
MSSKSTARSNFFTGSEVSTKSLKETTTPVHQYFVFDRLRRTKSMPKRPQTDKPKLVPSPQEASSPKTDYFSGFNRAKSRFFHSCRISKSDKSEKASKNPFSSAFGKYDQPQLSSRPSFVSEADTVASSLSSDDKDDESNCSENTCSYVHPMLAELEAELTTPLPPPRACPAWLKSALEKSQEPAESLPKDSVSSPADIATLAASVYSEDGSFLNYFDEESDGGEDVRIYPVLQNGVKISDTHYWVINPPPKNRSRQHQVVRTTLCDNRSHNLEGRPASLSTKLSENGRSHYENLPDISACSSPGTNLPVDDFQTVKLRRGRSECHKEVLRLIQRTLVKKLQYQVPTARLDECRAVLIGSSWNFQKAQRRLKVELLCRMGYVSKTTCERLLERLNWNFDEACELLRKSGSVRQVPPLIHPAHSPFLPPSASSTADVTPENSPDILYLSNCSPPIHE